MTAIWHAQIRKGEIERVKQANIVKRIVFGLLGTAVITSFILFASNIYSAEQAALTEEPSLDIDTKDENLSIRMSERHMLLQPQAASPSETADAVPSGQEETALHSPDQSNQETDAIEDSLEKDDSQKQDTSQEQDDAASKNTSDREKKQKSGKKTKQFCTVTEEYFSDALFIGDSRTVGMLQSHLLSNACYYAKTGIGIGDILSERIVNEGGTMISVSEALCLHTFSKVYIMIGINDISSGDTEWFTQQYKNILDTVRNTQPNAVIYIQGNIPMSYGTQDLNGALNNKNLSLRNEASRALADKKTIFYLDIGSIYADDNGNLQPCYTTDGLHVMPDYYSLWVDYLLHHAIV